MRKIKREKGYWSLLLQFLSWEVFLFLSFTSKKYLYYTLYLDVYVQKEI